MPNQISSAVRDIVMIGSGPAALSAALYTAREDVDTLLVEKGMIGGLAATTDWIDNYPGFRSGIAGSALADEMRAQAERFGAKFDLTEVTGIADEGEHKRIATMSGDILARVVLIATGSDHKKLDIDGEDEYFARGVHYCATCDGAFYRDKSLVVIGGGNSAVQEALFLTRFASHIDLLVRSELKASDVLIHELEKMSDKITVHRQTEPVAIVGDGTKIIKVVAKMGPENQMVDYRPDGIFIFIGLKPNTAFLTKSVIELDEIGLVRTNETFETSMPGVFAVGDVRSGATMQIASAVGEGATAALLMRKYLEAKLTSSFAGE
ncbi:FAD-dependent oxidoreductase [Candidatus Saccharibacteria bacterium]|nr:FAD-dependent oxidoreductase [Candidatus Saccharibacteria bacterium]